MKPPCSKQSKVLVRQIPKGKVPAYRPEDYDGADEMIDA